MIVGIDFGAKKSGTTVIARLFDHNKVDFFASKKNQDADQFILDFFKENEEIWLAYIDAPLSLPMVYSNNKSNNLTDYFFREADTATGAMSPMFLGGLTARAMKLSAEVSKMGIKMVETYPAKLAEVLKLKELSYKGNIDDIPMICNRLHEISNFEFDCASIKNWHYFDALLCLYSAKRFEMQAAMVFGNTEEGTITV